MSAGQRPPLHATVAKQGAAHRNNAPNAPFIVASHRPSPPHTARPRRAPPSSPRKAAAEVAFQRSCLGRPHPLVVRLLAVEEDAAAVRLIYEDGGRCVAGAWVWG